MPLPSRVPALVAFGLAGHGLHSQAVHLYSVTERTAVLLQLRWGTPLDDVEAVRRRYRGLLRTTQRLEQRSDEAARGGRFPAGQRLVVAHGDFHGYRWAWLRRGTDARADAQWHWSNGMAPADAMAELMRLEAGRVPV